MAELKPLYDKTYECLLCKAKFTSKKIRSRFVKVIEFESDFRPVYESEQANPILYYAKVCPKCGFSFTDDFTPYFAPGREELIKEKVCRHWVPQDYGGERDMESAVKTLKLAAYCGTLKKEKHITTAGVYIRLAWLYRMAEDEEQERRFLNLALHEYMESYLTDDFRNTQVTEIRMLYLIGELSRRTGKIEQAVRYFSKVIEKQENSFEPGIVEMARERWYEIREMQKNERTKE